MSHPSLEQTLRFALDKHEGVLDKGGAPYILHPIRVMLRVKTDTQRHIALLHDVLEDCGVTPDELRALGYDEHIVVCLDALTKRKGESYDDFITRVLAAHEDARRVKAADIEDNRDLSRIPKPTAKDYARLEKYEKARQRLRASF